MTSARHTHEDPPLPLAGPASGAAVVVPTVDEETLTLLRTRPPTAVSAPSAPRIPPAGPPRRAPPPGPPDWRDGRCVTDVSRLAARAPASFAGDKKEAAPAADATDEPPRYELLEVVGKGAMGEVHLARDLFLRRTVAFKSLLPANAGQPAVLARFICEAQITSQLDHPHIVPVYGLEVGPEGTVAYAMKLVRGQELAGLLGEVRARVADGASLDDRHRLDGRLEVFLKVCDAVAFAHDRGIVHRDLKPANIMLGGHHEVYVMDWGIARPIGGGEAAVEAGVELCEPDTDAADAQRTRVGSILGTPLYMSPEQACGRNEELDERSDQYSLGLILQEIVTLVRARAGKTLREVLDNAKRGVRDAVVPSAAGGRVPRELDAIIAKATALAPAQRYENVSDLAADVRRFRRGDAVVARPDTVGQRIGRWIGRHRMATLAFCATALVVAIAATVIATVVHHEKGVVALAHARELEMRADQERIGELVAGVGQQRYRIERDLARYESELEELSGASLQVAAAPASTTLRTWFATDYDRQAVGDALVQSPRFERPISPQLPVFVAGPDVEPPGPTTGAVVGLTRETEARSVVAAGAVLRSIVLDSRYGDGQRPSVAAQDRGIATEGTPLRRASLTLPSGLHMAFPGMGGYPARFDARTLPSYQRAIATPGLRWGPPEPESLGGSQVLTCSAALRAGDGALVAVATIEISIEDAISPLLGIPELEYVEHAMLATAQGDVLLHRRGATASSPGGETQAGVSSPAELPAEVRQAIRQQRAGYVVVPGERRYFAAFTPLEASGWIFVAFAPAEQGPESVGGRTVRSAEVRPGGGPAAASSVVPAAASSVAPAAASARVVSSGGSPSSSAIAPIPTAEPPASGFVVPGSGHVPRPPTSAPAASELPAPPIAVDPYGG